MNSSSSNNNWSHSSNDACLGGSGGRNNAVFHKSQIDLLTTPYWSSSSRIQQSEDCLSVCSSTISNTPELETFYHLSSNTTPPKTMYDDGTSDIVIVVAAVPTYPQQLIPPETQHQVSHFYQHPHVTYTTPSYECYHPPPSYASLKASYAYPSHPMTTSSKKPTNNQQQPTIFPCLVPHCNKFFSRAYNLKSHARSHSQDRPFACQYKPCHWKFARPHDLKRHELQHTGQKPHECDFCHKRFARSDALKRHLTIDQRCAMDLKEAGGVLMKKKKKSHYRKR